MRFLIFKFYHENYSEVLWRRVVLRQGFDREFYLQAALADSNLPFMNSALNRAPASSPDKGPSPPVELR